MVSVVFPCCLRTVPPPPFTSVLQSGNHLGGEGPDQVRQGQLSPSCSLAPCGPHSFCSSVVFLLPRPVVLGPSTSYSSLWGGVSPGRSGRGPRCVHLTAPRVILIWGRAWGGKDSDTQATLRNWEASFPPKAGSLGLPVSSLPPLLLAGSASRPPHPLLQLRASS